MTPPVHVEGVGSVSEQKLPRYWIEVALTDDESWWAAALFAKKDDRMVIVELRVIPGEDSGDATVPDGRTTNIGEWSRTAAELTDLPPSGITARLLRKISVGDLEETLRDAYDEAQKYPVLRALARDIESRSHRPGRKGRPDLDYARWAARYVDACRRSTSPVAYLAKESGMSVKQIGDVIHQARRRKLLEKTRQGKAGGELTPKAQELLGRKRGAQGSRHSSASR